MSEAWPARKADNREPEGKSLSSQKKAAPLFTAAPFVLYIADTAGSAMTAKTAGIAKIAINS